MTLKDFIALAIENGVTMSTTDSGQQTVTFDAPIPEIEGNQMIDPTAGLEDAPANVDETMPESSETDETVSNEETIAEVPTIEFATKEELSALIDRLVKLETLISAGEAIAESGVSEVTEIW